MSPIRKKCFVIMPFDETTEEHSEEYWTKHLESFLKPTIEECPKVEAYRSEALRGDILRQIITDLIVSPVVVADLTDFNPNVFWELGVRQSFKHGTVTIAQAGTKLPFDLSVKSTLPYYPKDHIKNREFSIQFKKAILDCLSHPDKPDSHVLETISGRGTLFQIIQRAETIRRVEALVTECEWNKGLFNAVIKLVDKNIKNPKKREIKAARFCSCAIELLLASRYLDESSSFYGKLQTTFAVIELLNDQLRSWPINPNGTERFFLKQKDFYFQQLTGHEKIMLETLTRIRKMQY